MSGKVTFWSATVAVAGFLFGFDTAVISGADQPLQALWQSGDLFHGAFIMSAALWGTVFGALGGNYPCERYGRKPTLIALGGLYMVSALGSALALDPYTFSVMRFVGGLGVGISSIVGPAYISEIAPAAVRGRLVALYQFQIVFGILVAYFSNYAVAELLALDWRWMLGVEAVPAGIFLFMVTGVPESPRWLLLRRNDEAECRRILALADSQDVDRVIGQIRHAVGQGAVIWVFIAEVFPNNVRTKGQSLGCGTDWVFAALITLLMPFLLGQFLPQTIFAFLAGMMVLQLVFVLFVMPETKGQSLEALAEGLSKHDPEVAEPA